MTDEVKALPEKQPHDPTTDDGSASIIPDSLKCRADNFGLVMFDELASLWERNLFCDVVFEVNSKKYKCHRIVLASISAYLQRIFHQTRRHVIRIRNIQNEIFENVLKFAYTGSMEIKNSNVFEMIFVCSYLEIPSLVNVCALVAVDLIDPQNCFEVIKFARELRIQTLHEKTLEFILLYQDKLFNETEICMNSLESVLEFFNDRTQLMTRNGLPVSMSTRETYFMKFLSNYVSLNNLFEGFADLLQFVHLPILPASKWKHILKSHDQIVDNALIQYFLELSDLHRQGKRIECMPVFWDTVPHEKWNIVMDKPTTHPVTESQFPKVCDFNDNLVTGPEVAVTSMELYFRPWLYTEDKVTDVLGGMKICFENGVEVSHGIKPKSKPTRLEKHIKKFEIKLTAGELISAMDLTFGWCINGLTFYTNKGRQLGPYGGIGGDVHKYKPQTNGQFDHFHCFSGRVVTTYQMLAITHLQIGWACYDTDNKQGVGGSENHETEQTDLKIQ
ncbi:kelch-like protein 3 [Ylistrum balloti]|uniref:kelch-like protein 3 n=1 Tax=Ylistrum balloti TaxID=509963 RepID=UPI002905E7B0|nr:kelch-like protein 3 [Ylistrum balloti]